MSIFDWFATKIVDSLESRLLDDWGKPIIKRREYRLGEQPKQLRVREGQYDDNTTLNYTGLITNRIVSAMFGSGIDFRVEGEDAENQPLTDYLDAVWDANHQEILLHRACLSATEAGTGYIQIQPAVKNSSGVHDTNGNIYPRLYLLDPAFVQMEHMPEDFEMVIRYTIQYKFTSPLDNKERGRKQLFERDMEQEADRWTITTLEMSEKTGGQWVQVDFYNFPYEFSPIVHWQNLPSVDSGYGIPDITNDMLALQDRVNFSSSNVSKVLRLFAHPMRYARNLIAGMTKIDMGPDQIPSVQGDTAEIVQLPSVGDLPGAIGYLKILRASMFDIARVVDIDTLQDKLGTLTNFGLKVLYQDQLAMIGTKRELFGDALEEINRRLLIMAGNANPPDTEIVWPDALPVNEMELVTKHQTLLEMGVEDKQTAAEELGIDWDVVQERLDEQQQASDNLGAQLLKAFDRGQGGGALPEQQPPNLQRVQPGV